MDTLLFDYGGTLDTGACHWSYVIEEGYKSIGLELKESDFRKAYVFGERALAKRPIITPEDSFKQLMLKKVDIELTELEDRGCIQFTSTEERSMAKEKIATYCDQFARTHVQQSKRVLQTLKAKYNLVMVSNFYGNLHSILLNYGIGDLFEDVIESYVVGVRKPDPAIWALGLKAANCQPQNAIAIGDSFTKDIIPALSLGCKTVWFKGKEWENKEYDESLPTHIITQLEDLLKIL